jgi:hypothetical protein
MNQRFAMLFMVLAMVGLLFLVSAFVSRVRKEGFRAQRGCQGRVRYGIAYHDRGGRVYGHGGW